STSVGLELGIWDFSGAWGLKLGVFHPSSPITPSLHHSINSFPLPMAEIRRATLFGKLNPIAYKAIESATVFCKMRGNPNVESVHWLQQLLQSQDSDMHRIIKHFQLDPSRVAADLIA